MKVIMNKLIVLILHQNTDIITLAKKERLIFINVKKIAKYVTIIVYVINAFQPIILIMRHMIVLKESQDVLIIMKVMFYIRKIITMGNLTPCVKIVTIRIIIIALILKKIHVLKNLILI